MKHHPPTISHEARTTIADVARWAHELARLHARISPRFLDRNRVGGSWPTCKAFSVPLNARMAGSWPNMPEKPPRIGCNPCSHALSGMLICCAIESMARIWTCAPGWKLIGMRAC